MSRQAERQRKGEKKGANKRNILVQVRKKEAKKEEAGEAVQKERGANRGNILGQAQKKGRQMEREKHKAQIKNKGEQRGF